VPLMIKRGSVPVVDASEEITLADVAAEARNLSRRTHIKNYIITGLIILCLVCGSGWWFTSRDNTATERNGKVADCRSNKLAQDLDEFKIIVSGTATAEQKKQASMTLEEFGSLMSRYQACQD